MRQLGDSIEISEKIYHDLEVYVCAWCESKGVT